MKNRLVFPLFSILLVSLLFSPNAFSEDTVVRVASRVWVSDTPQLVDIVIENGQNVAGYQVKLQFNSDRIEYVGIDHGDYLPNDAFFGELQIIDDDPKDSLKVLLFAATSFTGESNGDGTLATLEFKQKGAGSPLTLLDETFLSNRAGEPSFPKLEHSKTRPHVVRDLAVRSVQARPQNTTEEERHHYNIKEVFELRTTVKNVGNRESASPKLQLYGPTSKSTVKGSPMGSPINIETLEPNSAVEISLPDLVTAPEVSGVYYYTVCIEGYEGWTAPESGVDVTDNNCYTLEITVGTPNIVIDSVAVDPITVFPGETFDLSATVKNEGEMSSATLRFYGPAALVSGPAIEDPPPLDFTDTVLRESVYIASLPPDGTSKSTISVIAPIMSGIYYYGVSVESVPHESNNQFSTVRITVQPTVNIPDSNLLKVFETELGKNPGDPITPTNMQALKVLNTANKGIRELTGLEFAINLEELDLSNNDKISDVTPLADLTKLKKLDLSNNEIVDVEPLTELENLIELDLSNNEIVDVEPLTELENLIELDLSNNEIEDPLYLASLENLTTLDISENSIKFDVGLLTSKKNLKLYLTPYKTANGFGSTIYYDSDGNKTVLIKGLKLNNPNFNNSNLDYTDYLPLEKGNHFEIYEQDGDTCGHYSAMMLLHYYGVKFRTPKLGEETFGKLAGFFSMGNILPGTSQSEMIRGLSESLPVDIELFAARENFPNKKPDDVLRDMVSQSRPPILLIRLGNYQFHYVVVVGYDTETDKFLIADPNGYFYWQNYDKKTENIERSGTVQKKECLPALKEAWGLESEVRESCYDDSWLKDRLWKIGDLVDFSQKDYQMLVPTAAPSYHHRESETHQIYKVNHDKKWENHEWVMSFSRTVSHYHLLIVESRNARAIQVDKKGNTFTVSAELKAGSSLLSPFRDESGFINMFLTVYYEPGPAVPAPFILLSAPSINTALLPNYPNPFNPETWIPYQLANPADVALTIYDIQGRVVRGLDLGHQGAGIYQSRARAAHWDGRNAHGEPVASGLYFYTLKAGDFIATRKMLIRK